MRGSRRHGSSAVNGGICGDRHPGPRTRKADHASSHCLMTRSSATPWLTGGCYRGPRLKPVRTRDCPSFAADPRRAPVIGLAPPRWSGLLS